MIYCFCLRAKHRSANGYLLFDNFGVEPLVARAVASRIVRVELLDIEILYVGHQVCRAPGYVLVVTDDNAGSAYKRHSGYMIATVGYVNVNLMPDSGQ